MPENLNKRDHSVGRRRLIQIALGGSAIGGVALLPERWVQPVVDTVVLPVHAQTSVVTTTTSGGGGA